MTNNERIVAEVFGNLAKEIKDMSEEEALKYLKEQREKREEIKRINREKHKNIKEEDE